MRKLIWMIFILQAMTACHNAKEQAKQTVHQLSGGQMVDQAKAMKKQLTKVEQHQKGRYTQLNTQLHLQNE